MSNYTKTTNFATKDALPSGNPAKIVKGTEIDTEFNNIATAVATKANTADPTFTGTVTAPVVVASTSINIAGDGATVTGIKDEDDMASNSATKLATQQSIKAYVDSQVTAQDLDVTDGTTSISIDLDSEALSLLGGTGIDSTASGNGVTLAIDSTVATLTGTQTLTNKTLTSPDVNTPDIDGGTIDGTVIGGTTAAAGSFTTVGATGNITVGGTVDGRDVATDGTKLDTVETNADVTDTANVTAAGALMDSEVTNLAQVKAFDSTDYATAAQGTTADAALPRTGGAMTGAITTNSTFDGRNVSVDGTKLDGIEALADVTDTANVTAAGALMDSELTNITAVKALDQGVATTDSPSFVGLTASGEITANGGIALGDNDKATFGAGDDLSIFHDGTRSYISDLGTGDLRLQTNELRMVNAANTEVGIKALEDGAVTLYYNGNPSIATTSTGIDVTGTATMDGLTVGSASGVFPSEVLQIRGNGGTSGYVNGFGLGASNAQFRIFADDTNNTAGSIKFDIRNRDRILIEDSGDISFYEDTGTTPKFFWDASAESLGIGTSSPSSTLHLKDTRATLRLESESIGGTTFDIRNGVSGGSEGGISFRDITNSATRMRIDSSGNVGIGISSPSTKLHVLGGRSTFYSGDNYAIGVGNASGVLGGYMGSPAVNVLSFSEPGGVERMRIDAGGNVGIGVSSPSAKLHLGTTGSGEIGIGLQNSQRYYGIQTTGGALTVKDVSAGGTERMRIDSSGNLLVGTTSATAGISAASGGGFVYRAGNELTVHREGIDTTSPCAIFNQTGLDGQIVRFRKDGATVGSIGTLGNDLTVGNDDAALRFYNGINAITPFNMTTNSDLDDATDLGTNTIRFQDLYLSGGVYQNGTRLIKRTSPSSGGSGIFASITNAPQTGFIHIYEIGTNNYAILACTKRDTSSDVVTTVIANNVLTVSATNAGGTVAVGGHTSSGNVKMQATIIREA